MEQYLVSCCAPTLAGIKSGNMFNYMNNGLDVDEVIESWNQCLGPEIHILPLLYRESSTLILVLRLEAIDKILKDELNRKLLSSLGYERFDLEYVIETLKSKLKNGKEFPHEVGILLDYPALDVYGFIKNKGKNHKKVGNWKVYGDHRQSQQIFENYDKCKECFLRLYREGYKTLDIINKYKGEVLYE